MNLKRISTTHSPAVRRILRNANPRFTKWVFEAQSYLTDLQRYLLGDSGTLTETELGGRDTVGGRQLTDAGKEVARMAALVFDNATETIGETLSFGGIAIAVRLLDSNNRLVVAISFLCSHTRDSHGHVKILHNWAGGAETR